MTFLNQEPIVRSEMLIRKPVEEVFEAFINPEITTKFWFTKSSDRLETGKHILWEWEMYGVSDKIYVKDIEKNKRILVESSDGTNIEWFFTPRNNNETFVSIENYGFVGNTDEILYQCIDSMGGYTIVLCGLKAFLEHKIVLNLIMDKAPDAQVNK
ncbi:SRPBCC family protein [Paenibacillus dakarensis]|uniref:SRPBCC family protein n=1 Tax=Paenibacillus dakarensis TaxID=1527293 RepID=UPI0006D58D46|nr:SRPBCC family protein [Paenibacillus dakarensis]